MSIQQVQKDFAAQLAVRLFDSSDDPVVGVLFSALTVKYKKHGDAVWTTKTVLSPEWVEEALGRYFLLFSAAELDTNGRFTFRVSGSGFETFTGDVDVVADWATVVDMLTDLANGLTTKISISSIKEMKQIQDESLLDANDRVGAVEETMKRLRMQLAAIYRKIQSLSP